MITNWFKTQTFTRQKNNSQLLKKRGGTQPTNSNNHICVVTKDCSLLKLQASLEHNDFLASLQQKKL
jgi:hypothetical protein